MFDMTRKTVHNPDEPLAEVPVTEDNTTVNLRMMTVDSIEITPNDQPFPEEPQPEGETFEWKTEIPDLTPHLSMPINELPDIPEEKIQGELGDCYPKPFTGTGDVLLKGVPDGKTIEERKRDNEALISAILESQRTPMVVMEPGIQASLPEHQRNKSYEEVFQSIAGQQIQNELAQALKEGKGMNPVLTNEQDAPIEVKGIISPEGIVFAKMTDGKNQILSENDPAVKAAFEAAEKHLQDSLSEADIDEIKNVTTARVNDMGVTEIDSLSELQFAANEAATHYVKTKHLSSQFLASKVYIKAQRMAVKKRWSPERLARYVERIHSEWLGRNYRGF